MRSRYYLKKTIKKANIFFAVFVFVFVSSFFAVFTLSNKDANASVIDDLKKQKLDMQRSHQSNKL